jgi:cytochrome c oxidase subunit 2
MNFQSALTPAGSQAEHIEALWWVLFWTSTAVFVLVVAALFWAIARHRRTPPPAQVDPTQQDRWMRPAVAAAVVATVAVLVGLLIISTWTGRAIASLRAPSAVSIAVYGHQWWWEIEYEDAVPERRVTTANEIHLPIGRPVVFKVTSRDVIHSLWIPNLHGKRDLTPGYTTALWMQADSPGVYRGQCAEFCGRQHAKMALDVIAESQQDFDRWLDSQRNSAIEPTADAARRGYDVFMAGACVGCHTVRGTRARGQLGPDLTHVASRRTIGASTLPNTREHLEQWVLNSQAFKPGNQMPANVLPPSDLDALVAYLVELR